MKAAIKDLFSRFSESEQAGGVLLIICTAVSLLLTNSSFGTAYTSLIDHPVGIGHWTVAHLINDGLMAVFFLMVGLEVEREVRIGELADWSRASMPIAAAVGGMLVPIAIHAILNKDTGTAGGFAIPMATDIAFALGVLALAGKRIPVSVKVFLAALAIIDDIGAIITIAVFYTENISRIFLAGGAGIWLALWAMNRAGVRGLPYYLIPGLALWYCCYRSGIHATISGVLLATVIPFDKDNDQNLSLRLQQMLHYPVAYGIIPVFALVNTAILLPQDIITGLSGSNSLGIMLGLLVGKVSGIFLLPYLLVRLGRGKFRMQEGITWRYLAGIGMLGGIGFTMSMFITNLAYSDPATVAISKLSVLIASLFSATAGLLILRRK